MHFDFGNLKVNNKYKQFMLDFIIGEDVCNLNCDYCLSEYSTLKSQHPFQRENGSLHFRLDRINELVYDSEQPLKKRVDTILKYYGETFDTPILKISGGEILLVKNIVSLIKEQAKSYEVVQLLTNGVLITEEFIHSIQPIENLHVQLSLDGHTLEMNYNRVKSSEMNARLLKSLDLLVKGGIVTEIYCVITKSNINKIPDFLDFLLEKYGDKVKIFPFPVRQKAGKKMLPEIDELQGIEKIIVNYEKYKDILPPFLYIKELYNFMKIRKRKLRCYIPLISCQVFDDGVVTPCPNGWTIQIGNFIDAKEEVLSNLGSNRIYNLMVNDPPVAPFCLNCFTEVDVLNLYFEDKLKLSDLEARPLYRGKRVQSALIRLKQAFKEFDFSMIDIKPIK